MAEPQASTSKTQTRYVCVTGGVISGIGKGTLASSAGLLLKMMGLRVTSIKIDPYMNLDAGTMSPLEHGEVFVLDDGGEADLDLGNYERYLDITLTKDNNITTGKVYRHVIEGERRGDYLGKTVQVIPHVTDCVQDWIERVAKIAVEDDEEPADVCIIELGGTVGDIESMPFVEALRQFQFRVGQENFALIHVSLVPVINGEQKTKPIQASIRDLRGLGLAPDLIACRCEAPLDRATINKISMFCHVGPEQVLGVHNVASVYHVPLLLRDQGIVKYLQKRLNLGELPIAADRASLGTDIAQRWRELTISHDRLFDKVHIVLVGKYISLKDSYMSVIKSLEHAALRCHRKLILEWVDSEHLEPQMQTKSPREFYAAWQALCSASGVLVPGGFGLRGTEGMILAAQWAREKKVPFLGICLGFQMAVVEYARNVCGVQDAQSGELDESAKDPVIIFMPEISRTHLGGTMRLGLRATLFTSNSDWSVVKKLYGNRDMIWERHRHRYEVSPNWVHRIEKAGLIFTGRDEKGERMQVAELQDHPYYVGMQAHPEFCTRPLNPSPSYLGFVAAASGCLPEQIALQANYQMRHAARHLRFPSNPNSPNMPSTPILPADADLLAPPSIPLKVNGTNH